MIKNEKQYRITAAQANEFAKLLNELKSSPGDQVDLFQKAEREALQSQYDDLKNQINEYLSLKDGHFNALEIQTFADLPRGLIRARIASGMSQKDLADRLSMKEQQIQRYEATNYAGASLERIQSVITALGLEVRNEVLVSEGLVTQSRFFNNLKSLGFEKDFILNKILPSEISSALSHASASDPSSIKKSVIESASIFAKAFSLDTQSLLVPSTQFNLNLSQEAVIGARFKKPKNSNAKKLSAYAVYAHMMALNVLEATKHLKQLPVPEDAQDVRKHILRKYGEITFDSAIRYIWSLGIPIVPLSGFGNFNGACWRVEGRNVIVLKQKTLSESRWLHDVFHELCHAGQDPDQETLEIIEPDKISKDIKEADAEEEANDYSAEVLIGENVHELAYEAIMRANQNMRKLQNTVVDVSNENNVDAGALANYIAFRLALEQGTNWWGSANNLQSDSDSWSLAADALLDHIDLSKLNTFDQNLLTRAIS